MKSQTTKLHRWPMPMMKILKNPVPSSLLRQKVKDTSGPQKLFCSYDSTEMHVLSGKLHDQPVLSFHIFHQHGWSFFIAQGSISVVFGRMSCYYLLYSLLTVSALEVNIGIHV